MYAKGVKHINKYLRVFDSNKIDLLDILYYKMHMLFQ